MKVIIIWNELLEREFLSLQSIKMSSFSITLNFLVLYYMKFCFMFSNVIRMMDAADLMSAPVHNNTTVVDEYV